MYITALQYLYFRFHHDCYDNTLYLKISFVLLFKLNHKETIEYSELPHKMVIIIKSSKYLKIMEFKINSSWIIQLKCKEYTRFINTKDV